MRDPQIRSSVTGQIIPVNPAASVKAPKHVVKKGKTPVPSAEDARTLLDSIATEREEEDGTKCPFTDQDHYPVKRCRLR
jgi:hypothetical protein